ncbi:PREDICTED: protein aurora borealis [Trachymyrmex cornetzi]|uniref:protein aurora borealis n=1 Tax=Trachymyrmex cornetzi TaxID=471704 RepID=UPI00084ED288|nr:PREDICTED: protein aurora borealis [Trachymyrmex cornetzi]
MEQTERGMLSEERKGKSPLACSSWRYGTPMKRNNAHLKRLTCHQNNAQRLPFAVLPNHITPPSKLRKFITKNPFEPDLINRLHLSAISPNLFAKVSSPMQQSPEFTWSIDELARIKPVKIEESPLQQMYSPEPELEIRAQAAIDRFFKQNQIIPSPWNIKQKGNKPFSFDTPNRSSKHFNSIQEVSKSTKDAWSQTILSLPPELSQDVEESLKPFFTFTQEQNVDYDDANLSNNSLRRKLFACHDESTDNDNDSFTSLSPVKTSESMVLVYSPPQSGMFVHGTPLKMLLQTRRQSNSSSVIISENVSPNISPIHNAENNKLYKRIEHCSSLATRLNFATDMETNDAAEGKSSSSINGHHLLDMSDSENDVKCIEDNGKWIIINNDRTNASDSVNMEETKSINSPDNTVHSNGIVLNDKEYNETSLKIAPEVTSFSRKGHKQSNIMSGAFEQQSISNSIQDTGYQTYSMNSMMHTIDSSTSMNQKTLWNERIMTSRDIAQLSWKENMTNVFSSTPSKYNKERESGT